MIHKGFASDVRYTYCGENTETSPWLIVTVFSKWVDCPECRMNEEIEYLREVDKQREDKILKGFAVAITVAAIVIAVCWYFLLGEL